MRKRVRLYEVWYKVPAHTVVLRTSRRRATLFNPANPLHQEAVRRGIGKVEKVLSRQVRCAIFAGPYRLFDYGTTKRHFPYVPFFAFRDDEDRSPYGLIEGMIAPQDEYNERRLRMQWLLKARQVMADNDALDHAYNTFDDLAVMANRPDMNVILNAGRKNADGVKVMNNLTMQEEQYKAMEDARMLIQDQPGVYPAQMGQSPGSQSGVAIQSLVEQGTVTMGGLYDNFMQSRLMGYELLLDMIVEDHSDANLRVMVGQGSTRRMVVLNSFAKDGTPVNQVADLPLSVGFSEVPVSASARQQTMTMLAEVAKSLGNPQAAAVLIPSLLEVAPLDKETRRTAAENFSKIVGLPTGTAAQRKQGEQAAMQERGQAAQLEAQEKAAKADQAKSAAELNRARVKQIAAQIAAPAENLDGEINAALDEAAA